MTEHTIAKELREAADKLEQRGTITSDDAVAIHAMRRAATALTGSRDNG